MAKVLSVSAASEKGARHKFDLFVYADQKAQQNSFASKKGIPFENAKHWFDMMYSLTEHPENMKQTVSAMRKEIRSLHPTHQVYVPRKPIKKITVAFEKPANPSSEPVKDHVRRMEELHHEWD